MKRRVTKLAIFLLLGAIINVAVAWGCAAYLCPFFEKDEWIRPLQGPQTIYDGPAVCKCLLTFDGPDYPDWHSYTLDTRLYGLPMFSLRSVVYGFADQRGWVGGWELPWKEKLLRGYPTARLPLWIHASHDQRLPLLPIWPGFAINTIFYAAIVWVLFAVPGYLKRRRRIKRGECVRCAYLLRSSAICSECGTPVTSARNYPQMSQISRIEKIACSNP